MSKVYLVGAGPGDPGLLTLKGKDALARADCVLYDNLANPRLLDLAPPGAERIYVGKKKAEHPVSQEEICALLVGKAREGKTVVRLKGGDPFIFGRGGEEAEALADAGVPFEVVPGVTTPLGIAAYCGVPLTHREHTSAVTFVTGHDVAAIDWAKIGHAQTLVLFMGLTHAAEIAQELIRLGKDPATPALAVRWATRPDQQTIAGTLCDIASRAKAAGIKPPVSFVIGEVVRLREKLGWFERLPLFGKRIVVTRAREQTPVLASRLRALGADAIELPAIATIPAGDPAPLDQAIARLGAYDWIVFTSANGVRYFLDRLDGSPQDLRAIRAKLCAIGPATRAALEALHLKVDLMPEKYVGESLVEAFSGIDVAAKRVLLPRAAVARDTVPRELAARGAIVDVVEAYRTVVPESSRRLAAEVFTHKPDWVTFTSSSTVKNLVMLAGREALAGVRIASIGPVTSETARSLGVQVDIEAREHTMEGLVAALLEYAATAFSLPPR
jgi:uroporphyrinogen III methyltransferase/synthase